MIGLFFLSLRSKPHESFCWASFLLRLMQEARRASRPRLYSGAPL